MVRRINPQVKCTIACLRFSQLERGSSATHNRTTIFPNQQSSIWNVINVPDSHDKRRLVLEGLEIFSKNLVYVEKCEGNSFLATVPLRALAQKFSVTNPTTVVMGEKVAGKTLTFMQLLKSGS